MSLFSLYNIHPHMSVKNVNSESQTILSDVVELDIIKGKPEDRRIINNAKYCVDKNANEQNH